MLGGCVRFSVTFTWMAKMDPWSVGLYELKCKTAYLSFCLSEGVALHAMSLLKEDCLGYQDH